MTRMLSPPFSLREPPPRQPEGTRKQRRKEVAEQRQRERKTQRWARKQQKVRRELE